VTVRLRPVRPLLAVAGLSLVLTACTSGADPAVQSPSPTDAASSPVAGELPAVEVSEGPSGVTVVGGFGEVPEVTVPEGEPPTELIRETLVAGDGDLVAAGDLLVADYQGRTWDDEAAFDSSFERGEPAAFGIGVGAVIDGWDQALVGVPEGSRVLLSIPPELGYGEQGAGDDIPGGATLVFVVDVVESFGTDDLALGDPVGDLPDGLPTVTGDTQPTVDVSGADEPRQSQAVLINVGSGDPIEPGTTLVVEAVQVSFGTGETTFDSWTSTPLSLAPDAIPGLAEALEGQAVGSRVLALISAEDNNGDALAIVLDVLGAF
jgi:peptidylprolyl isomerase